MLVQPQGNQQNSQFWISLTGAGSNFRYLPAGQGQQNASGAYAGGASGAGTNTGAASTGGATTSTGTSAGTSGTTSIGTSSGAGTATGSNTANSTGSSNGAGTSTSNGTNSGYSSSQAPQTLPETGGEPEVMQLLAAGTTLVSAGWFLRRRAK